MRYYRLSAMTKQKTYDYTAGDSVRLECDKRRRDEQRSTTSSHGEQTESNSMVGVYLFDVSSDYQYLARS